MFIISTVMCVYQADNHSSLRPTNLPVSCKPH